MGGIQIDRLRNYLTPTTVTITLVFYCIFVYTRSFVWTRRKNLPPGPPRKWITGNLHQIPKEKIWLAAQRWSKIYGPLVYIRVLRNEVVFLNDAKSVMDLLDTSAAVTSGRPIQWMVGELARRNRSVFMTQGADPRFKLYRRLLQDGLNVRAAKSYRSIQMAETRILLRGLLETPEEFRAHIRRNAVAVTMKIAYGYQVADNDDPFVNIIEDVFSTTTNLSAPGKFWVEFLPFLRFVPEWMPGAGFKKKARDAFHLLGQLEQVPHQWAKERILSGDYIESFTSKNLIDEGGKVANSETEYATKWTSAALYAGGGDTTVSTLTTFFLLMARYPEVQKQAQKEIDQAIPDRLPTLDDLEALPFNKALLKEVLRWGPVTPLGLPHTATEDIVYNDHLIPKGTTIFPNIWTITHDNDLYPEPDVFDPLRHLGDNPQLDPLKFVFGFGRRICPGAHLAQMSLLLNITNTLAIFEVKKPLDKLGKDYEPPANWLPGITTHLEPFDCRIIPRSQEKLALLAQWESIA